VNESPKNRSLPLDEELLQQIFEHLPGGVVHVHRDGSILQANGKACELLGLSFDRLAQRFTQDFAPETTFEDGSPCPVEAYPVSQALQTGQPQPPLTIGVKRPDGTLAYCVFTATPLKSAQGELTGALVTFLDVTQRKEAELALRRSKATLRSVLDSAPDFILSADREGKILFLNRASPPDDAESFVGRSIYDALDPDEIERVRQNVDRVLSTGCPGHHEARTSAALGGRVFGAHVGPVVQDGKIVGVTMVSRDLTEDRALQLRLNMADRLASVGRLAAGIAHEVNNPLNYVTTSLEQLQREFAGLSEASEAGRAALASAIEGTARMRAVVQDLRSFSRASSGERALLDVEPVLDAALRMAQHEVGRHATVRKQYSAPAPVLANEARMCQVFLNLIVNAAHAMANTQERDNELLLTTKTDERGRTVVEVTDTGSGIPAHLQGQIFEPFVTTKAPGLGLGLGLSICRDLVSQAGGELGFDSLPGQGTTFRITLPPADIARATP
jgi:PAS domain S-box-containing protein